MRIVSSLLIIFFFILMFVFLGRETEPDLAPSAFLPTDTLIYVEQHNGSEAINKFKNSKLGKALNTVKYKKPLRDLEIPSEYISTLDRFVSLISTLADNKLVNDILGQRCSVALLPPRDWAASATSLDEYIASHSLLVSKPKITPAALKDHLDYFFRAYPQHVVPYGRFSINRYELDRDTITVVFTNGFMLASLEERVIREALTILTSESSNLSDDPDFQNFSMEYTGAERMLYFSIDGLQELAHYGAQRSQDGRLQAVLSEFSNFKGLKSLSYGAWRGPSSAQDRFLISYDIHAMESRVSEMIGTPSSLNDTLPFVAQDVLFYYWSNTLNSKLLWEMYVEEAGTDDSSVAHIQSAVKDFSGYGMEELIEMIDSNVAFLLRQSDRKQFVPIPDMAVLIRLNDPDTINEIVERGLADLDINIQSRKYKGVTYNYWGLYEQESLQPVYAIHRDYLILANTFDILRSIIDTPIGSSRLIGSKSFNKLDPGFQKLNNSVCYVNQALLLSHIRELVGWGGTLLAIQDREAAHKTKILIDELLDPLFTGMSMYSRSATRTYSSGNSIVIESKTEITH